MSTATRLDRGENIVSETIEEVAPTGPQKRVTRTFESIGYCVGMLYRGHLVDRVSNWTEGGERSAIDNATQKVAELGITKADSEPMLVVVVKHVIRYERVLSHSQMHPWERHPDGTPLMCETYERPTNTRLHSQVIVWSSKPHVDELDNDQAERLLRDHL